MPSHFGGRLGLSNNQLTKISCLRDIIGVIEQAEEKQLGARPVPRGGAARRDGANPHVGAGDADLEAALADAALHSVAMMNAAATGDATQAADCAISLEAARRHLRGLRLKKTADRLTRRAADAAGDAARMREACDTIRRFLQRQGRGGRAPPHEWRAIRDPTMGKVEHNERKVLEVLTGVVREAFAHNAEDT